MKRNSTRSYWMDDKSWYRIVDGKPELTPEAPPEAQRSFAEWNSKPKEKHSYHKPNMNNLKGKKGKAVLANIREMKATSLEDVRKAADECIKRILDRRRNEK